MQLQYQVQVSKSPVSQSKYLLRNEHTLLQVMSRSCSRSRLFAKNDNVCNVLQWNNNRQNKPG